MAKNSKTGSKGRQKTSQSVLDPLRTALKSSFLRRSAREQSSDGGIVAAPDPASPASPNRPASTKGAKRVIRRKTVAAKRAATTIKNGGQPKVSPLAPASTPKLGPLAGLRVATASTGMKYKDRPDLFLALFEPGSTVAGVFTKSSMAGAPVDWCRTNLDRVDNSEARALIVNAGNANAFTGRAGVDTVKAVGSALADLVGCRRRDIYMASTGVIGEPFDPAILTDPLPRMIEKAGPAGLNVAAGAIMTTDTFPKAATRTADIDGVKVTIHGIAKGSGMIAPDMATMLSFVFTDAAIPAPVLQTLLMHGVRDTFNTTTVDSDTSTSDTVLMFATGAGTAHTKISRPGESRLTDFREKLTEVLEELAKLVVRDGEGASKFVTVKVTGADSPRAARAVAFAIGNSPLVKTAVAGEDPNWGRVIMAVGKSGEKADRDKLEIKLGGLPVAEKGARSPDYDEAVLAQYMKESDVEIAVDLGVGKAEARIWTCDLTHGYISINSDYRS